MERTMLTIVAAAACLALPTASAQEVTRLADLTVTARRPMTEIGVQKTSLDSMALKENISLSIADILTANTSVFVKSAGRASLSTVSFRGTSPSHTSVSWNGLPVNNPMLGMTDFSTIPAYLIDKASLLHGSSSLTELSSDGGLGGAVVLSSEPDTNYGTHALYAQGIGSFKTFDEFLRISHYNQQWAFSSRVLCSSSANDYTYINRDKKLNIYDEDHNITGQYHPKEKNRLGSFRDLHLTQDIYRFFRNSKLGLNIWYTSSNREIPMLSTDYSDADDIENRQRQNTLRVAANWETVIGLDDPWWVTTRIGYIHDNMAYDYARESASGIRNFLTRSRSRVNSWIGSADILHYFRHWQLDISVKALRHDVRSADRGDMQTAAGYSKARNELTGAASVRCRPVRNVGISVTLREEIHGAHASPLIPALFAEWTPLLQWGKHTEYQLTLKASGSRNYHAPSLNDLYFMPGGNPGLRDEKGISYDCGAEFSARDRATRRVWKVTASADWFDSYISDWIIWLPTFKGFFSPANMKKVHAYGVETGLDAEWQPSRRLNFHAIASYSWTPSINVGEKLSSGDASVGKQLPYIPRHSASATIRADWRSWSMEYKWHRYSERYTMTSNATSLTGTLPAYSISDISLEKSFRFRTHGKMLCGPLDLNMKLTVRNLMDAEYLSVLSHPMPGTNFEFFVTAAI